MKSFYSLIRYVNNPLSRENIAIGLIVLSGKHIFHDFSQNKINFVSKINPDNFQLFDYTFKKINSFIKEEAKHSKLLFQDELDINSAYLERLSIYNNGIIQFDKPVPINVDFDELSFRNFFEKYIDINVVKYKKPKLNLAFKRAIVNDFSAPLRGIIDIDVKLKKEQIPGLFFDYKLDGIGINGKVYSVKSIDLNCEKNIDTIQKEISEFETLNYRIDKFSQTDLFAEMNQVESKVSNQHYLVLDNYIGDNIRYKKLYEIISEEISSPYKVIGSNELYAVTDEIKKSGARKFLNLLNNGC